MRTILAIIFMAFATQTSAEQLVYFGKKAQAVIMYGEILNKLDFLDINGNRIPASALYHIRLNIDEAVEMKNQLGSNAVDGIIVGVYICTVGLGHDDSVFYECRVED